MKPLLLIASLCAMAAGLPAQVPREEPRVLWFPFPKGVSTTCAQGPFGPSTHHSIHAWDFMLREGTPILAPADGTVTEVIDDRTKTGIRPANRSPAAIAEYQRDGTANANKILISHPDGTMSSFMHHKARTARVKVGDRVVAGQHLADVGMTGTYVPHLCFSLWKTGTMQSLDVRFRSTGSKPVEVKTGTRCTSVTPPLKK